MFIILFHACIKETNYLLDLSLKGPPHVNNVSGETILEGLNYLYLFLSILRLH